VLIESAHQLTMISFVAIFEQGLAVLLVMGFYLNQKVV
jgi:hypothetical protein